MIPALASEIRIAGRTLIKTRGFTAVAVLMLALGIALNAAVLAVVNAYLLRSLPYPGAKRLHNILYSLPGQNSPEGLETLDWSALADVIEHPIAWDLDMFYLIGGDHPERAPGAWVTPGFMQGLGVRPGLGRVFSPNEFQSGSPQVAMISHSLWMKRFGGDPHVIGRRFEAYVSDRPQEAEVFTVIGVLPSGFWHVNPYTEILAPLRAQTYPYMARLRDGVPSAEAERRITELVRRGIGTVPATWQARVRSTHGEYVARLRPILIAVATAAGLVLLIACANVALLLLIRAARRQKEIAVRMALGGGRAHLARMLMAEALLLGVAATVVGIGLCSLFLESLAPLVQQQLGRLAPGGVSAISLDPTVLAAAAGFCLFTVAAFSLAPLLASWGTSLSRAMQRGPRSGSEGSGARQARSVLIAMEVAGSLALLAGCGMMIRSVAHLLNQDLGIRAEPVFTAQLALRERGYPSPEKRLAFYERLLPRVTQVPGVKYAGLANWWVLQPGRTQPIDARDSGSQARSQAGILAVSPDYFTALGVALVEGRPFASADRIGSEPVALVSETLARRLWQGKGGSGRRLRVTEGAMNSEAAPRPVWRNVVGVVRDVRQSHTDLDLADVYIPLLQAPGRFSSLYLLMEGVPKGRLSELNLALKEIDPEVSLGSPRPLQSFVDEQSARPRFLAWLLSAFALLASLLALLGVYGVVAYSVRQREHEVAVRIAVGADPGSVIYLFIRQGAPVLLIGITAGIFGAAAVGRMLETQLYHVDPGDPWTIAVASIAFASSGLAAMWWPARRAARTDPALALREE